LGVVAVVTGVDVDAAAVTALAFGCVGLIIIASSTDTAADTCEACDILQAHVCEVGGIILADADHTGHVDWGVGLVGIGPEHGHDAGLIGTVLVEGGGGGSDGESDEEDRFHIGKICCLNLFVKA